MSATTPLSTIRSRLRLRLDDSSFDGTVLDRATNDYLNDLIGRHQFVFMETSGTASNVAGDYLTPLPADMQRLLTIVDRTYQANLTKRFIDYDNFVDLYPTPDLYAQSPASNWTLFGSNIVWSTPLNVAYSFKYDYLKAPTQLTGDTDICVIPDEFIEVVVIGAIYRIQKRDDDTDLAMAESPDISRLESALVTRYGRGQNRGGPRRMMAPFRG